MEQQKKYNDDAGSFPASFMIVVFRMMLLAVFCCPLAIQAEEGWFPFVIPSQLSAESPMNIGKLVLDAPAGKHGFIRRQSEHFYFDDGTPARFWGTGISPGGVFISHEQIDLLADRLAFMGVNIVRMHSLDNDDEPNGIFKSDFYYCGTNSSIPGNTLTLSPTQLDRLDYMIYALKQRGIYIDMNLLISRDFTAQDGVLYADELRNSDPSAGKPASLFDPVMVHLQKQYAHDLLNRVNPFTGLAYRDEPALAFIEVTNENSRRFQ